ncbi:MAG: glycosyltransferase family 4 protein [Clostridia bacterium]
MKKVLMIADEFPPMGGAGVQRTSKFAKYLALYQYIPFVFTRDIGDLHLRDDTLLKDIPEYVQVTRTKAYNLLAKGSLFHKIIYYKLMIPDGRYIWYRKSREKAARLVDKVKPDLLYTTSFPYSGHLFGLFLKRKYPDLPWVADFRDEWTNNSYVRHNIIRRAIEKRMEKNVLQKADALIANTPVMMDHFIRIHPFSKDKFTWIPNGFDLDDFYGCQKKTGKNQKFTMVHTGSIFGIRKPDHFLAAVSSLVWEGAVDPGKIQIKLIGNLKEKILRELIAFYRLEELVTLVPYLPHKECINAMVLSDCCVLIEGNTIGAKGIFTGKLFEYLYAGAPVLGIVPKDGVAEVLIRETRSGLTAEPENVDAIKDAVLRLYRSWEEDRPLTDPDKARIMEFERKNITRKLSEVFDKLIVMKEKQET